MHTPRSAETWVASFAGLAPAALGKLIYDLFNGYAVVPNLLLGAGFLPPPAILEPRLLLSQCSLAFAFDTKLLKKTPTSPGRSAAVAALPWIAL